jgi:hypothetical protein
MSTQPEPVQLQIEIEDVIAQGMYANLALVSHTETEFVFDFIYAQAQVPKAKVRARILSSPAHTKRLLAALQENMQKYEEKFGAIKASGERTRNSSRDRGNYL